jgi:SAM-dependent methyltransferase
MIRLFSLTLFWSAFLLFSLQPMVGKLMLPIFGGTPAVWNVCLVFFQMMLLAGYLYAHGISRIRSLRLQAIAHLLLLGAGFAFLLSPLRERVELLHPMGLQPAGTLLFFLLRNLGLPFLLISASSSLLQSWFSRSNAPGAGDPYFLFVASNLGSLLALVFYPLLFEPFLRLSEQYSAWRSGYAFLAGLIMLCALVGSGSRSTAISPEKARRSPSAFDRIRWTLLALVPSSLLVGTTTYLATDVAAVPLLWGIPLLLYLGSYILAFSRAAQKIDGEKAFFLGRLAALGSCFALLGIILESNQPAILFYPLHLVLFFLICLLCHLKLARLRPEPGQLTEFYLALALGGALGGMFNALLAPLLFPVVAEYPLMLILGSSFRRGNRAGQEDSAPLATDILCALAAALLVTALAWAVRATALEPGRLVNLLVLGVSSIFVYRSVKLPRRYALGLASLYLASLFSFSGRGHQLIYRERTFFGTSKVEIDSSRKFLMLFHGSTLHGQQFLDPRLKTEPLAYFSRKSPVADAFARMRQDRKGPLRVGIIGLGAGTLAAYAFPGDHWTFYEIDPSVIHLARDSGYFSFLRESKADSIAFVTGDARLTLNEAPDASLDLLVLDAFSSDSIPAHFLTREAMQLYWRKLAPGGLLALNISNRYFNLAPTLGALGSDSGGSVFLKEHELTEAEAEDSGDAPSSWIAMTRKGDSLSAAFQEGGWKTLRPGKGPVWTDDYSNVLSLLLTW